MVNENKTTIRLEVDKTIQPRQFEPIKVIVDVEETFIWKDDVDRVKKMKFHTNKMTEDFVTVFDQVVKRIGEKDRCIGRVVVKNNKSNTDSESDEFEIF